jgi:hypothetical protein
MTKHPLECRHSGRLPDQTDPWQTRTFRLAVQNLFQSIQRFLGKNVVAGNKKTAPGPDVIQHLVHGFAYDRFVVLLFQYAADQSRVPPSGQQDRSVGPIPASRLASTLLSQLYFSFALTVRIQSVERADPFRVPDDPKD